MEFLATYIKDLTIEEIGEEDEAEFEATTWGHALVKAEAQCQTGFLLQSLTRTDIE